MTRAIFCISILTSFLLSSFSNAQAVTAADSDQPSSVLIRCESPNLSVQVWFYLAEDGRLTLDTPDLATQTPMTPFKSWARLFPPQTVSRVASEDFELRSDAPLHLNFKMELKGYNRFVSMFSGGLHKAALKYEDNGVHTLTELACELAADAALSRF